MDISEVECEQYDIMGYTSIEEWMNTYVHNGPFTVLDYINYFERVKVWI